MCELFGGHLAQVDNIFPFVQFFDLFQIDSLAENFCLLENAHKMVHHKSRLGYAMLICNHRVFLEGGIGIVLMTLHQKVRIT